jgi:predicted alpha/beta hydrolase family esterase
MKALIVFVLLIIFFILYSTMKKINEMIIFQPTITEHDDLDILIGGKNNIIKETIKTSDNIDLWGVLYNKNKTPSWDDDIIIYSHGNAGWMGYLLDSTSINSLSKYGSVFLYDYRGYGISSGKPSEEGVYNDIMSVWNHLVNDKNVHPNKIIIYGHSLGCAVSTKLVENLCQHNKFNQKLLPKTLILEAPFINMKNIAKKFVPNFITNFIVCNFNNEKCIKNIKNKVPIYILHSKNDEIIPYEHGCHLSEISGCKLIEINGTHNYPLYTNEVEKLFENLIKQ